MGNQPSDAGKTSGGGSLGHDQPRDVSETTPIRNQADRGREGPGQDDEADDPVMPANDSTLNTKI